MRILCICTYGHSRSVGACRVLHKHGHEAVAAGASTGSTAIPVLAEWADKIVCMVPEGVYLIKTVENLAKVVECDIGPDRWSNPYNQEMLAIIEDRLKKAGLI